MKVRAISLLTVALVVLAFPAAVFAGYSVHPRLLAGQTEFAGVVGITGDSSFLTVTYVLRGGAGWCLNESHVHAGMSLDDIPQTKRGNPILGQFDHKATHDCSNGYTYQIPVQPEWYGNQVYIAAHAALTGPAGQQETGWAVNCGNLELQQFPGRNWAAYAVFPANAWY